MSRFKLDALSASLETQVGIEHAVLQSLLNWAKAQKNDPLETGQLKRGWWATEFLTGTGCRDWTLAREKQTPETLARAKHYTKQALEWMISQKIASDITVECSYKDDRLNRLIRIFYEDGTNFKVEL